MLNLQYQIIAINMKSVQGRWIDRKEMEPTGAKRGSWGLLRQLFGFRRNPLEGAIFLAAL